MRFPILTLALLAAAGAASAQPAPSPPAPPPAATPVAPVTVSPETPKTGQVVASTEAVPLVSPDFTDKDARYPPMAVKIAPNAAFGRQTLQNTVPPGLLENNPDLGLTSQTVDVGVTVLF